MNMKTATSSLRLHPLIVFLALFFSTNTVQPLYTNSFNPNNYLQGHYIEYVITKTSDYFFSLDFTPIFQETTTSAHHQQSSTTATFARVTNSKWLPLPLYFDTAILFLNSIQQTCFRVSVHIRFIQHQSLSDCDPDQSFLI